MPVRIFTIVDLPAPFSPMRAVTSPAFRRNATSWRARTPGNDFETPIKDRMGAAPPAMKFADVAKVTRTGMDQTAKTRTCARRIADRTGGDEQEGRPRPRDAGQGWIRRFWRILRCSTCRIRKARP